MTATFVGQSQVVDAFGKAISNSKLTIVDVAKMLDITIVETSRIVADLSQRNEKLNQLFLARKWPRNLTSGYIFTGKGELSETHGERAGILKPGMHVFAEKIRNKAILQREEYYFLYMSHEILYRRYRQKYTKDGQWHWSINRQTKQPIYFWFEPDSHEYDIKREELAKTGRYLQATDDFRIGHVKGTFAAQVNGRSIVSVNQKW